MREYNMKIDDKSYTVIVRKFSSDKADLEINGKLYSVQFDLPKQTSPSTVSTASRLPVSPPPVSSNHKLTTGVPANRSPEKSKQVGDLKIVPAPIPGSILQILVNEGDTVETGQAVIIMEAMKMENEINVTKSGIVRYIRVKVGDAVNQGAELMAIE